MFERSSVPATSAAPVAKAAITMEEPIERLTQVTSVMPPNFDDDDDEAGLMPLQAKLRLNVQFGRMVHAYLLVLIVVILYAVVTNTRSALVTVVDGSFVQGFCSNSLLREWVLIDVVYRCADVHGHGVACVHFPRARHQPVLSPRRLHRHGQRAHTDGDHPGLESSCCVTSLPPICM